MYGRGTRTWEYSPAYALRSYLYLGVYWSIIRALQFIGVEAAFGKVGVFYGVRVVIGEHLYRKRIIVRARRARSLPCGRFSHFRSNVLSQSFCPALTTVYAEIHFLKAISKRFG